MGRRRKPPAAVSQARAKVAREAWAALTPTERSERGKRAGAARAAISAGRVGNKNP